MTLVLVRHGETPWNADRRMQGRTDNPLSAVGRAQARATARLLAGGPATRVVSSPLVRARQTAAVIAHHLGIARVDVDADLVERGLGDAEGLPAADAAVRWPDADYPGAEPIATVLERGVRALERVRGSDAIVVAHGLLLRTALERVTGAPVERIRTGEHLLLHVDGSLERPTLDGHGGTRRG